MVVEFIMNNNGPNTEPCSTPHVTSDIWDMCSL